MKNEPHSGRIGWLCAALLFGVLAGGGIAWLLQNSRGPAAPVVIYQMASPSPSPATAETLTVTSSGPRRRHQAVHSAQDLPDVLRDNSLAAGVDGSIESPAPSSPASEGVPAPRKTVLVDGVALTQPTASTPATPVAAKPRVQPLYGPNSAQVDDSLELAIEGLAKYVKQKGYALREDDWGGELTPGKAEAITQQLFKGNDYWFSMGTTAAGSTVRVRLYDGDGNPADTNYWQHEASDGSYAAAEIQCEHTGLYYVVVSTEKAPEERIPWGLVYAYR